MKQIDEDIHGYLKDLVILYFVICIMKLSYTLNKERIKMNTNGAIQLAIDLDFMLKSILQCEIIDNDPVYGDKLKQLKELARWRRYIKMFFIKQSNQPKDNKSIEIEIGDLKNLKRSVNKKSDDKFKDLQDSLSMLDILI